MLSFFKLQVSIAMTLALAASVTEVTAQTNGFRIETDVYATGESRPIQQTVTLFADGIAYDISRDDADAEVTMVQPALDRIVLLHKKHKVQTEVKISELAKLFEAAKAQAMTNELAPFISNAEKIEVKPDRIIVGDSKLMKYEATLQSPEDSESAASFALMYRQFADAAKYLNAYRLRNPPFARLALNAQIAEKNFIPKEITLEVNKADTVIKTTCRLIPAWKLSDSDRKRVAQIGVDKMSFTAVSSAEYQRITSEKVATR